MRNKVGFNCFIDVQKLLKISEMFLILYNMYVCRWICYMWIYIYICSAFIVHLNREMRPKILLFKFWIFFLFGWVFIKLARWFNLQKQWCRV